MGKVLTQAQKTFTDLYDSYVLNLSSDIVAVPCDQYGKATEDYTATITYSASIGTESVGSACEAIADTVPGGVSYNISTPGTIKITVHQGTELEDDSEMGFKFATTNSNSFTFERYISFVKIKSGEKIVSFQITSEKGNIFKEGMDKITLRAVAFDGLTEISDTDATYQWRCYDATSQTFHDIDDATTSVFVVAKTDKYSNAVIQCVMRYNDNDYEDVFSLSHYKYNYEAVAKFFNGSNTIEAAEPFVVTYVQLYKDHQLEDDLQATSYFYDEDNCYNSSGLTLKTEKVGEEYQIDGKNMYFIYRDEVASGESAATYYTVETEASPSSAYGTVTPGGRYQIGSIQSFTAKPHIGFTFLRWLKNGSLYSNNKTINVTVNDNIKLTAEFSANNALHTIVVNEQKTIDVGQSEIVLMQFTPDTTGTYRFESLGEADAVGYLYSSNKEYITSDDESGNDEGQFAITCTLTKDVTYYLGVGFYDPSQSGEVIVKLTRKINNAQTCEVIAYTNPYDGGDIMLQRADGSYLRGDYLSEVVDYNECITLIAVNSKDYVFTRWSDDPGATARRTVVVTEDSTYYAMFEYAPPEEGAIYYTIEGHPNNNEWGSVNGSGEYVAGSEVVLTAVAFPGYEFVQWNDGTTNSVKTFTASENVTYIATFKDFVGYTVSINAYESDGDTYGITKDAAGQQPHGSQFEAGDVFYCYAEAAPGRVITRIDVYEDGAHTDTWEGSTLIANGANADCTRFSKRYNVTAANHGHNIVFYVKFENPYVSPPEYAVITEEVTASATVTQLGEYTYLKFVPQRTGTYVFKSLNQSSIDPQGIICDKDMYMLDESLGDAGFALSYNFSQGVTYYLGITSFVGAGTINVLVTYSGGNSGSNAPTISGVVTVGSQTVDIKACSVGGLESANLSDFTWFKFTPGTTGQYIFQATGGTYNDTCGVLHTFNQSAGQVGSERLDSNEDNGADWHFLLAPDEALQSGVTYCLGMKFYNASVSGQITVSIRLVNNEPCQHNLIATREENRIAATCTTNGSYDLVTYCTSCSTVVNREPKVVVATGHVDSNNDGKCDVCGTSTGTSSDKVIVTVRANDSSKGVVTGSGQYSLDDQFNITATATGNNIINSFSIYVNGTHFLTRTKDELYEEYELLDSTYKNLTAPLHGYIFGSGATVEIIVEFIQDVNEGGSSSPYTEGQVVDNVLHVGITQEAIPLRAYTSRSDLSSVVIHDYAKSIGPQAFALCINLSTVVISASVTTIGAQIFYGCTQLTDVYYTGSQDQWKSISIDASNAELNNATIHYNYVSNYTTRTMMMSTSPMTLALDYGIAAYSEEVSIRPAKFKAKLYQYSSSSQQWVEMPDNSKYVYKNDLYDDVTSNIVVVSKADISSRQDINFTIFSKVLDDNIINWDNDLIVARTHTTIFDLNDPIVSSIEPKNPKEGQMWLDQSVTPWELKIYKAGQWVRFEQQGGQKVFTSIDQVMKGYEKGDLWVLESNNLCGSFTKGTMIRSTESRTAEAIASYGGIFDTDWVDAQEWASSLKQDMDTIKLNMQFSTTSGLRIGKEGKNAHVNIDSGEVGIYDENNQKVVHISNQTANIDNLSVDGSATFNDGKILIGSSFALQLEGDGSLSLVKA